eukprot:UN13147
MGIHILNAVKTLSALNSTTAELFSRKRYGYGSFVFAAQPGLIVRGSLETWTCFSLYKQVKGPHSRNHMVISFCFLSSQKSTVFLR